MTHSVELSSPKILIPSIALEKLFSYLDPQSRQSVMRLNRVFAQFMQELAAQSQIDWSNWDIIEEQRGALPPSQEAMRHIFSFLQPEELARLETVSQPWKSLALRCWKTQATLQSFIMEHPSSTKRAFQELYRGSFNAKFYEKYLGKVGDVPPIPQRFLETASQPDYPQLIDQKNGFSEDKVRDHYQLMLVPAFITVAVSPDAALALEENGKLVERISSERAGQEFLTVPVTLNNLAILVNHFVNRKKPICFHQRSWKPIFLEHGNTPVKQSRWVYQKKEAIFGQYSKEIQLLWVGASNRKIVSFIDRVFFNLLVYIKSGIQIDRNSPVRTSTKTVDLAKSVGAYSTLVWNSNRLLLSTDVNDDPEELCIYIAVEVPETPSVPEDGVSYQKGIEYYYKHARTVR